MNTINKTRFEALKRALDTLQNNEWNRKVEVTETHDIFGEDPTVTWGVNWSCCGTQSPEAAYEMANNLAAAADIAQFLNEASLELDYTDDPIIDELLNDGRREEALRKFQFLSDRIRWNFEDALKSGVETAESYDNILALLTEEDEI